MGLGRKPKDRFSHNKAGIYSSDYPPQLSLVIKKQELTSGQAFGFLSHPGYYLFSVFISLFLLLFFFGSV